MLVGAAGSGKTTVRHALVAQGLRSDRVVSLDDLRRSLRAAAAEAGRPVRDLQAYTLPALRAAATRQAALLDAGAGYLADATHLRRRERVGHVRAAHDAGLPAVALLLATVPWAELQLRNATRPPDDVVPVDVLERQAHRHGLLDEALLRGEGFDEVVRVAPGPRITVSSPGTLSRAGHDE